MIIGLGNPGREYALTRHNVGFMVVDRIAEKIKPAKSRNICGSEVAFAKARGGDVALAKPQTFMNLSGRAVAQLVARYSLGAEDITVIHDDIDIPHGKIKEKKSGGSAGHNGIESIIDELGTGDFRRLRIGVGRPLDGTDPADYVLNPFEENEMKIMEEVIEECAAKALNFD